MNKDVFWFPHDYDAVDDDKITLVIDQLGMEGYGIYWLLIEKLRGKEEFKMPFSSVPSLARKYCTTQEKIKAIITQYGLFEFDDDGFFYSRSLIIRMQRWIETREKRSNAGKLGNEKRWGFKSLDVLSQCDSNAIAKGSQSIAIIEENRIEDNITINNNKHDEDEFIERMYKLYPTKCPKRGVSLGKGSKDKELIRKLLKTLSKEDIEKVINYEIKEKYGKAYMSNFGTFLRNFPDVNCIEEETNTLKKNDIKNNEIINGEIFR